MVRLETRLSIALESEFAADSMHQMMIEGHRAANYFLFPKARTIVLVSTFCSVVRSVIRTFNGQLAEGMVYILLDYWPQG